MTIPLMICLLMFIWVPMFAQTTNNTTNQDVSKQIEKQDTGLLSKLAKTRIVLKDGSIKKNCRIKEINSYWIVFEKDGSLHDQMIDKIKRIEICDGKMNAVIFDKMNKPKVECYSY